MPQTKKPLLAGLVAAAELHPRVTEAGVGERPRIVAFAGWQQIEPHRAVLRTKRIEHGRQDFAAHQHQGSQLENLGLAGAIAAAQHHPSVREPKLRLVVFPEVDDADPQRLPA